MNARTRQYDLWMYQRSTAQALGVLTQNCDSPRKFSEASFVVHIASERKIDSANVSESAARCSLLHLRFLRGNPRSGLLRLLIEIRGWRWVDHLVSFPVGCAADIEDILAGFWIESSKNFS